MPTSHRFCTKLPVVVLFFCLSASHSGQAQQLYINEVMASNTRTLADASGSYEDWFEVYNPNPTPVDLAGYYLTDNLANPTKYRLPTGSAQTIIPANGFLLLWASEELARGPQHVNFKLSADGESIGLYRPDGITVVDQVTFGPQRTDISWGRQPDGSANWLFFQRTSSVNNTSPGASNNSSVGYTAVLNPPVFSRNGGFYSSAFSLSITSPDPSATIYYTLDGSEPDPANLTGSTFVYKNSYAEQPGQPRGNFLTESYRTRTYSEAIPINDVSNSPNRVSAKSSTFSFDPNYLPASPVFKGTVVRAIAHKANAVSSDIGTQTYFITPNPTARYGVPVIAIGVNEADLFDYNTGIYTAGVQFDTWRNENPGSPMTICTGGNYANRGDAWERPARVEFFLNGASIINQPVKIAINGGCSRSVPRKSLRLYGDTNFEYPFFSNRPARQFYNRLLLRNGGNDWNYSLIVDSYMQTMVRHLPFDTQANRPSVLFLNGEYWGIHSLNERYDKYYLNRNYGVDTDSVDVVKVQYSTYEPDEGDMTQFNLVRNYFDNSSTIDYDYVKTLIDVESFSDHQMAEIYSANTDWPQNNQQFWRKRTNQYRPNAPLGHDGRFRWMMNDIDFGLSTVNQYTENSLGRATENTTFTRFLNRLLDVPAYRSYFINRYADLLNTTFDPTRTVALLTSFQQDYQPYMAEHFSRWNSGNSLSNWLGALGNIKTFVENRPAVMRNHIREKFGLTANQTLTVNVSDTARGYVRVNTIDIRPATIGVPATPYPWTGTYFQGNAIRIVAKPKPGYRFVAWQEAGALLTTDTAYSYNPTSSRTLTAIFQADEVGTTRPVPYPLSSCDYRFTSWSPTAPARTYPPNMLFVSMNQSDPPLTASFALADSVKGAYNLSSSTRINGLNADGIALINTGGTNSGYVASALGGVLLGLRTTGVTSASVQWTGGTVTPNPRQYGIQLRYRVGDSGSFQDLLDANNQPVTYQRSATAGHSQVIGPVTLPTNLLNKPYVQLLWQYYHTGVGSSGARDQLRIDDIVISRDNCRSVASGNWNSVSTWSCGRIPTLCDNVVIDSGHIVTLATTSAEARSVQMNDKAQLRYTTTTAALRLQQP